MEINAQYILSHIARQFVYLKCKHMCHIMQVIRYMNANLSAGVYILQRDIDK